ncbi:MAG: deoxyguanosinetriphosphate triphosphohydrolase [Ignavibacteria bacterium]|nr:deoxyguanosinetriphosphate triphosphohydrolase [Ignavibacteria bacterium]MBT8383407.1 deoxyguanosinetriphosphate triphosphohydrolase [Ignavibacteria bacterium]MBT8390238.1 deoxyguanosinetriphosphate triphosphohydrolase [Ignavibacteria bacterium]NNJ52853.1 deoxyguanosinetriphosphate triphosphohydrolase [Ignavibacteriaceae bacterium]NNL20891.1 deoxyguanosinetriphosphate triphosphohydrolase [Ignavibacteriaceae bacterium]
MNWNRLLNNTRLLADTTLSNKVIDGRSEFQKDFDRIVFSPAFRRLQDKTQVFPLPESDFVHTRLTHSLEVSCVGRSIGNLVGETIVERHPDLKSRFTKFHFGEIVAAACLAHDIGNPPFGHSGEDAIAEYFISGNGREFQAKINDEKKWNDLTKFEGNAEGFRIITRLQNPRVKGGLRLTHSTLAAVTKYPRESLIDGSHSLLKSKVYKKYGFFQTEKELFKIVANECSLKHINENNHFIWCRHPLAYIVEAADDICYRIMDLEDGFRLGLISFKETEELLQPLVTASKINYYDEKDEKDKVGYLRAVAIRELVTEIANAFLCEEKNMLEGKFESDLISVINSGQVLKTIKDVSVEKIYNYRSVVEREVAGYKVLGGLLDTFTHAYNEAYIGNISNRNRTIFNLLPKRITDEIPDDIYKRLLWIIDFVSGMTDSFAVSLFRKINGISLPSGRVTE